MMNSAVEVVDERGYLPDAITVPMGWADVVDAVAKLLEERDERIEALEEELLEAEHRVASLEARR